MKLTLYCLAATIALVASRPAFADELTADEMQRVLQLEQRRIEAIDKVIGSVVAIYDDDRQGGGSGVIIDPSGIALTNHHVIMGAGIKGWGGLADGKLYRWTLIGTDPGGDVAIVQMEGRSQFPHSKLGDSDTVQVGDWALAMGNPFILTEDQKPTVTLGIVSGIQRYQPGAGANQLVYGNCIQVDSSINPGNSGGPLFNLDGEVIGINGRGSFLDRGRVNVGLGYAISANQIRNFIPDLLATKLVEHGTLDASFTDRGGRVICSTINRDAPVSQAGLTLGDELLEFEGIPIQTANQFTNLVCTLPENWPARLKIRHENGEEQSLDIRMFGLPYRRPSPPRLPQGKEPTPQQEKQMRRAQEMYDMLSSSPGTIRSMSVNRVNGKRVLNQWQSQNVGERKGNLYWKDQVIRDGTVVGEQQFWLSPNGKFKVESTIDGERQVVRFDGKLFWSEADDNETKQMTLTEAKLNPQVVQALSTFAASNGTVYEPFGQVHLDGSDKASGQSGYRFKLLDQDKDWFYFWLTQAHNAPNSELQFAKASAEMDCDRRQGGLQFENWESSSGWQVAKIRQQIRGLSESVVLKYELYETKIVELQADWFSGANEADEDGDSSDD